MAELKTKYLKVLEVAERLELAKAIKKQFCRMTKVSGAVINPIGLTHRFYELLQENRPNNNNTSLARNLAYLYSCLCNEYCLMAKYLQVNVNDDFFCVPKWKWKKYMIGGKLQAHTKLLKEMRWIDCRIQKFSKKPFKREMYSINLVKLMMESKFVNNFQSEKAYYEQSDEQLFFSL